MDWLNYHHLLYFWHVAKEGSVSKAAAALHVAQPTVSAQVRSLERALK
ncbi:MAG: LysR family transcriptional regulator, partial [Planctomycetaceae bacterium]